jgi:hypothetical protein
MTMLEKLVTNYLGGCDFLNYHINFYPRMKQLKRQLKNVKNTKQQTTNNKKQNNNKRQEQATATKAKRKK